ncbi:3-hydroxyacyl-CoA dehydrogenase family protein [Streptomyces sp. NPDC048637]|uniref:3-hydroxyacyl-CoA dehydrogenase family protein n=1 Tax=Streptomyces sp. NPDC048637 TaxID=3155636 RepID=UPI00342AC993
MSNPRSENSAGRAAVGVVGAGTMGVGVAQSLAEAGHPVVVVDPVHEALDDGPRKLRDGLRTARLLRRTQGAVPAAEVPGRIRWAPDTAALDAVDFVIECAPERMVVKETVFKELDAVCLPDTVFASCTSAIPVATLAAHTRRPNRVLGTHFMNPVYLKDAVEVIRGPRSGDRALVATLSLLSGMGKRGHVVNDAPGFVSNRVLMPMVNDAAARVEAGTADAETVDRIFQDCFGHAMGPLRTADLIGLDTIVDTLYVLLETTGDARYEPCSLLLELVRKGHRGRKSGRGFHVYGRRG